LAQAHGSVGAPQQARNKWRGKAENVKLPERNIP